MKAGFGLIALLLGVGLMLFLMAGPIGGGGKSYLQTVTDVKKEKEPLAQQWGTKDEQGRPFHESLTFETWPESGPMKGALVQTIDPAGVAATYFGLQAGDVIKQIGQQEVGGFIINNETAVRDFLDTAFARRETLQIDRNGEPMELPEPAGRQARPTGGPTGGAMPGIPGLPARLPTGYQP